MADPACNLPFERVPMCACDPGTGPVPRHAEIFRLRAQNAKLKDALEAFADHFGPLEDNIMLNDEVRACFAKARSALGLKD